MLRDHCRESLTAYKVPRVVHFRDDLPKSPVGKVLRKDLRDLAAPPPARSRRPMDPVCHTLTGLAMGHAGLRRRTPLALTTLVLAANAPDIDIVGAGDDHVWMYFRRGWTHGPPAMVAAAARADRAGRGLRSARAPAARRRAPPARARRRCCGSPRSARWSHPLLDYMNSFGIRLLMPFSGRWFYGDALYIVDPWLYAARRRTRAGVPALARGPLAGAASARRGPGRGRPLRRGDVPDRPVGPARSPGRAGARRPPRRAVHGHAGGRQSVPPGSARRPRRPLREGLRRPSRRRRTSVRPATAWRSTPTIRWPRGGGHAARPPVPAWSRFPFFVVERTRDRRGCS